MRVFTTGGAHMYRQDTPRRGLGERFSRGGTISHQQRIHVPTPLSPEMVLSLFWLSIGMAFVSSCLVSRFSSVVCQSFSFIFALAAFFLFITSSYEAHVLSVASFLVVLRVTGGVCPLQPFYRFSQEDCLSFARRLERKS